LPAGQAGFEPLAVELEHELPAQLDFRGRQLGANITPTVEAEKGGEMAKQITCECGFIARADSDDQVVEEIREHMRSDHPELLDTVSRDDLLGWIEEV
jgi:predicted small metal-binding protein